MFDLNKAVKESGFKIKHIHTKLGVSRARFWMFMKGYFKTLSPVHIKKISIFFNVDQDEVKAWAERVSSK